jgi:hypothetical protein
VPLERRDSLLYNLPRIPVVHDRDEFWLRKCGPERLRSEERPATPAPIRMPLPSYWPILLAGSLVVTAAAALISVEQVVLGGLLTLLYLPLRDRMRLTLRTDGESLGIKEFAT